MKPVEMNFEKDVVVKFIRFATKHNNWKFETEKFEYEIQKREPVNDKVLYNVKIFVKNSKQAFIIGGDWVYFLHKSDQKLNQWDDFYADQKCEELGLIEKVS
jgi:hypothetical protein